MSTRTEIELYDRKAFPDDLFMTARESGTRVAGRIVDATTMEQVFDALEGHTSKDMVGQALTVTGVSWTLYESAEGLIPNAIVEAASVETGEAVEFATTSTQLVAVLRKAQLIDGFPFNARIGSVKTRDGFTALKWERL